MYPSSMFDAAHRQLSIRRNEAQRIAQTRRSELLDKFPELEKIENQLGQTGCSLARAAISQKNSQKLIEQIYHQNQKLIMAKAKILSLAGLPENYLEPPFFCKDCSDTGYIKGKRCHCLEAILKKNTCEKYFGIKNTADYTLEGFLLHYYSDLPDTASGLSPRQNAMRAVEEVKNMLSCFPDGRSLLLLGGTGLGKTHLSVAAASEVVQRGYTAAYSSAQSLIDKGERDKFGRSPDGEDAEFLRYCNECDLLVIDDLGSEYNTPLATSIMFNMINTRLLEHRSTIISSNCTPSELSNKYSDRLVSRLIGDFKTLILTGKDIRLQKRIGMIK